MVTVFVLQEEEPFPALVPVSGKKLCAPAPPGGQAQLCFSAAGEASLRRCFDYFEEVDFHYYKRFFRRLSVSDNAMKSKEELPYEDRIHQLLHIWMEKEGRGASLDQLLQVLLDLDQRGTAENIKEKALLHGHYRCEG